MLRPTLIDLNPVELKYYPFMISLNKCTGSWNKKWNNKTCQCECKNYCSAKKIIVGILAHAFVRIVSSQCWWNYICYGYCINKKDKCYKYSFNKYS